MSCQTVVLGVFYFISEAILYGVCNVCELNLEDSTDEPSDIKGRIPPRANEDGDYWRWGEQLMTEVFRDWGESVDCTNSKISG